jgi:hypothetical protein
MQWITKALDWVQSNRWPALVACLVIAGIAVAAVVGCNPKVQVPAGIATQMRTEKSVPLDQAKTLLDDFRVRCETQNAANAKDLERLSGNINQAEAWQANVNALLWSGITTGADAAGKAIPGLGAVLPTLTGLLGALFFPRIGERKRVDAAYDQGRTETIATLASAKGLIETGKVG